MLVFVLFLGIVDPPAVLTFPANGWAHPGHLGLAVVIGVSFPAAIAGAEPISTDTECQRQNTREYGPRPVVVPSDTSANTLSCGRAIERRRQGHG